MDFVEMDTTARALLFGGLFLVALAAVLWAVYDSMSRPDQRTPAWSAAWWIGAGIGAVLVLPALVINAFNLDVDQQDLVNPFSYLAIAGAAAAVVCGAGYYLTREEGQVTLQRDTPPPSIPEPEPTLRLSDEEETTGHETVRLQKPPRRFAYLIIQGGLRAGHPTQLGEVTNIGRRGLENDIVLDDEGVSRRHACVKFDPDRTKFVFWDLASSNGSWLVTPNGKQRIEAPHPLSDGDVVELGSTTVVFKEMSEALQS